MTSSEPQLEVLAPLGPSTTAAVALSERLPDPSAATIAFVWNYDFFGDEFFAVIQRELEQTHPGMRFVGHNVFGDIHDGVDERSTVGQLPDKLREQNVDAVILGVGA